MKIYEYLAAGKPVVSRDLPKVRHMVVGETDAHDLLALYSRPEEFVVQLRAAFASNNPDRVQRRQNFARRRQWCDRVDVLAREIAGVLGAGPLRHELDERLFQRLENPVP